MHWSAASSHSVEEIRRVCSALNANRVQIEREIEDCVDAGLLGKGFEDTNTRVRLMPFVEMLQCELSIQVTFASLLQETKEHIMTVANKVDECAGTVLRTRMARLDARAVEQERQMRWERPPVREVPVPSAQPAKPAKPAATITDVQFRRLTNWMLVNLGLSLLALFGVVFLFVLFLFRR